MGPADEPYWNDVAYALREAGISEQRPSASNRCLLAKWLPSWDEFLEYVTQMEDARCKVASLCMYGSQMGKEMLVQLRRDAIHPRAEGVTTEMARSERPGLHGEVGLFLPERILQQVDATLASYDEEELVSGWLLPSRHRAYRRRHMAPNTLVQLMEHEAARQGIPLTCHRIQLAGAVNAVVQGEDPERVFIRLEQEPWRGELATVLGRSGKPSS